MGHLADGTLFAPKYLENKLKFSPYIREAVCIGQDRPFVAALLNIDVTAVGSWAERRGLAYTSYTDLSQKPEVYELVREEIARMNRSLLEEPQLRGAQIRRFLMLHKELDPDDQEITRTRKVRRGFIAAEVRRAGGGALLGPGPRLGGGEGHLRGRPDRHRAGRRADPGGRGVRGRGAGVSAQPGAGTLRAPRPAAVPTAARRAASPTRRPSSRSTASAFASAPSTRSPR